MKKVLFTLIATLAFCGTFFGQETHWPDFNLYFYEQHSSIVNIVQIDDNIIGPEDNWENFEIAAVVNGTIRGHAFMVYQPQYGDLYPIVELEVYYDPTAADAGKEVSFLLYDHSTGREYAPCTAINPDTEENFVTGDDYLDYSNPMPLTFFTPTFTKPIHGYTEGEKDYYYLVASPIGEVHPSAVQNMTSNNYDLYAFDQNAEDGLEWINMNGSNDNLVPGKGYLYANSETIDITFRDFVYEGSGEVTLYKNDDAEWAGWNLVGNPFGEEAYIDRDFYVMNPEGTEIVPAERSKINVMEGVFVIANENEETMTFTTDAPNNLEGQIVLNVTCNRGNTMDRAIVRFGQGGMLPKFMLNQENTKLYIPQNNDEFAVVRSGKAGRLPVNFKPAQNGTYTISANADNLFVWYLHLIDHEEGLDVDLLQNPSYRFEAKAAGKPGRFELVFKTGSKIFGQMLTKGNNEDFGFCSNGNWIINNEGEAILQVVDINGQILSSEEINGSFSKHIDAAAGLYMLRLIKGNDMKVQKIVIE